MMSKPQSPLPTLATTEPCTGCAACASVCPHDALTMEPDAEGFLRPQIDAHKCRTCGLCSRACPVLQAHTPSHTPAALRLDAA